MFQTLFEWFIFVPTDYVAQEDDEEDDNEYDELNDYIKLTDGR
jgi:hypothetical protein